MIPLPATVRNSDASLLDVANVVLRRWKTVLLGALVGAALFAALSFLVTPNYLSETKFAQADAGRATLSGSLGSLASQFGVISSAPSSQLSLPFLKEAIVSRDVLDSVLLHPLAYDSNPTYSPAAAQPTLSVDPITFFKGRGKTPAKRLDRVRTKIAKGLLKVTTDTKSGIVTVTLKAPDPYVCAAFLRRLVVVLNDFNLHTRQTASHANRVFLEGRVAAAKIELDDAETNLRRFYEQNRRLADAPSLQFEEGRHRRQVELSQQIYMALSQDLERARTDEVKDTPVLTVVETAQPPVRRYSPKRRILTLAGMFVGVVVVVLWGSLRDYVVRASRSASPAWDEFERNLATVPGGPSLARRLARPVSRSGGDRHG